MGWILEFLAPKVPAELVALVLGIAVTLVFGLGDRGVELIADVVRRLAAPSIPDLQIAIDNWETVIGAAVGLVADDASSTSCPWSGSGGRQHRFTSSDVCDAAVAGPGYVRVVAARGHSSGAGAVSLESVQRHQ